MFSSLACSCFCQPSITIKMNLITRYLMKSLFIALLFISLSLVFAVWLTQILRFLELVVDSGAPAGTFFHLLALIIPRLLEVILPIGALGAILFIYNKMILDNELIVMRAAGLSQAQLIRPALWLVSLLAIFQFFLVGWISPASHAALQEMRQEIKAQYSSLLIREGVFNRFGDDVTVYVREKDGEGRLKGLMIHQRGQDGAPGSTIIAENGLMVSDIEVIDEENSRETLQIIVSQGSRQERNPRTGHVSRLDFNRYTIDVTPEKREARVRWVEPDERTLTELFFMDESNRRDMSRMSEFKAEIHRRFTTPILLFSFSLTALACLLAGPFDRRGQNKRIMLSIGVVLIIQSAYLSVLAITKDHLWAASLLYAIVLVPVILALMVLHNHALPLSPFKKRGTA